jgi:hypothetical protein
VDAIALSWTDSRHLCFSRIDAVRRPAIMMLSLMVAQLCQFVAFITRVMWGRDAAQPNRR